MCERKGCVCWPVYRLCDRYDDTLAECARGMPALPQAGGGVSQAEVKVFSRTLVPRWHRCNDGFCNRQFGSLLTTSYTHAALVTLAGACLPACHQGVRHADHHPVPADASYQQTSWCADGPQARSSSTPLAFCTSSPCALCTPGIVILQSSL